MFCLSVENAVEYLRSIGHLPQGDVTVRELAGGVSNVVIEVRSPIDAVVIKQALPRLNVKDEWLAKVERLQSEVDCLRLLEGALPPGSVPAFRFFDADRFIYGMNAISDRFAMWKAHLLEGDVNEVVVSRVASLLARIHGFTWENEQVRERFNDREAFWQLRVDPYYVTARSKHPDVAEAMDALITDLDTVHLCLVHGDYSPKNVLVATAEVVLLDFEVAHFGDPAFDVAFMLNHLLLKSVHVEKARPRLLQAAVRFWDAYAAALNEQLAPRVQEAAAIIDGIQRRAVGHLGAQQLARVDGKSPAEYLVDDASRERVRTYAKWLLKERPDSLKEGIYCGQNR